MKGIGVDIQGQKCLLLFHFFFKVLLLPFSTALTEKDCQQPMVYIFIKPTQLTFHLISLSFLILPLFLSFSHSLQIWWIVKLYAACVVTLVSLTNFSAATNVITASNTRKLHTYSSFSLFLFTKPLIGVKYIYIYISGIVPTFMGN